MLFAGMTTSVKVYCRYSCTCSMINKQTRTIHFYCGSVFLFFLQFKKSTWDFLGFNFGSGDILRFCFKSEGFFWVLIPDSIRTSPSVLIQRTPPPPPPPWGAVPLQTGHLHCYVEILSETVNSMLQNLSYPFQARHFSC